MKKYDVEAHIERKVMLLQMCQDELDVLGSVEARRTLRRENICYQGDLPEDQDLAQAFLEKCKRLVAQPATTHVEFVYLVRFQ